MNSVISDLIKASLLFKSAGLHTNAIHAKLAVVIVWVFYLEIVPWRLIQGGNKYRGYYSKNKEEIMLSGKVIEEYCVNIYRESIITHQKSFAEYINNHCNVDLEPLRDIFDIDPDVYDLDPISMLRKILKKEGEEEKTEKSTSDSKMIPKVYWQRSIQGQYIFEVYLWQKRSLQNLMGERIVDIPIDMFPQFGVRSFSIALTLSGRSKLRSLKKLSNDESIRSFDESIYAFFSMLDLSGQAVFYYYRAILYISQSSGNEQEMTFPPQSLVYYNLWEVLLENAVYFSNFINQELDLFGQIDKLEEGFAYLDSIYSRKDELKNKKNISKGEYDRLKIKIEEDLSDFYKNQPLLKKYENISKPFQVDLVLEFIQFLKAILKYKKKAEKDEWYIEKCKNDKSRYEDIIKGCGAGSRKKILNSVEYEYYGNCKKYSDKKLIEDFKEKKKSLERKIKIKNEKLLDNRKSSLMLLVNNIQYYIHSYTSMNTNYENDKLGDVGCDSEVPYSLCHIERVAGLVEKHLSRTMKTLDPQSKAHQEVLFEKYYLNDDYDDPVFISDVFFYKAFAYPAKLHQEAVNQGMRDLWKAWGLQYEK